MQKLSKLLLAFGTVSLMISGCSKAPEQPQLKEDTLVVELGNKPDLSQIEFKDDKKPDEIAFASLASVSKQLKEPGKFTTTINTQFGDQDYTYTINIKVEDTQAPKFTNKSEKVEIPLLFRGNLEEKLSEDFKAEDNDSVKLSYKLDKVDLLNTGEYPAKVIATDPSGNTTEFDFIVYVREISASVYDPEVPSSSENTTVSDSSSNVPSGPSYKPVQTPVKKPDPSSPSDPLTYFNGIPVVNKKYGLPEDYAPGENPQAVAALRNLIADMNAAGFGVSQNYSGFRSYQYQSGLYNNYVAANGQQQADTFSARPGFSEHQTGLAFDLIDSYGNLLEEPNAAQWLLDHAADYGFIVRYQAGKEAITGYMPEPWHLRYIGPEAKAIADSGLCLEEYLGAEGGDYR